MFALKSKKEDVCFLHLWPEWRPFNAPRVCPKGHWLTQCKGHKRFDGPFAGGQQGLKGNKYLLGTMTKGS